LGIEEYNVLVTIFTDGEENASQEYSGELIKKLVEDLKTTRWTFAYIGADHDVDKFAFALSITNVKKFRKNKRIMMNVFAEESKARYAYSEKIRNKQETANDFYGKEKK